MSKISPTLAEFFNIPYYSKKNEEDVVLALWKYITLNRLLIDFRVILLDKVLSPIIHPYYYYHCNNLNSDGTCNYEESIILVYIAKMHMDPEFIELDISFRLSQIRKRLSQIRIRLIVQNFVRMLVRRKNLTIEKKISKENYCEGNSSWLRYLATHYTLR